MWLGNYANQVNSKTLILQEISASDSQSSKLYHQGQIGIPFCICPRHASTFCTGKLAQKGLEGKWSPSSSCDC